MKIAIIGDMHWGIKGGDANFLEFQKYWFEEALKKIQAAGIFIIIQTGDMFDVRSHMKLNVMHTMLTWFPDILDKYGIREWITYAGNHDVFYRDINDITSLCLFKQIKCEVKFAVFEDTVGVLGKLAFVPWLNKNNEERLLNELSSKNVDYVFGHFEMIGMPMIPGGIICDNGLEVSAFKKYKRVISGHFHTVSNSLNCTMVGTPYHLNWGDVVDGNNRGFWTLDTNTDELELIKNEDGMSMFAVIEYDHKFDYNDKSFNDYKGTIVKVVVNEKDSEKHYKKFVEILNKASFLEYKIIDNTIIVMEKVTISEETISSNTLDSMSSYIDLQEQFDDVSKESLKMLSKEIYMEVLSNVN